MIGGRPLRRRLVFSDGLRPKTLVLCYHAVSETWPAPLSVSPRQLREQMEWLLGRGYVGATFSDAVATERSGPTLVVTFDDAFGSVLDLAYPILADLGLPATVFVVTNFTGGSRPLQWQGITEWRGAYDDELRGLTWTELGHLAESGWEVGSHTCSHPPLTQLADAALARELRESREACEQALQRPCQSLAYPYGDFDARVCAATADAGYTSAAIEDPGPPAPFAWPRIGIWRNDSMQRFRLKVSPTLGMLRALLQPPKQRSYTRLMLRVPESA
jgi:peptidoglycan/xylan/chitin deacetylase (PgdA/CDA1 family)